MHLVPRRLRPGCHDRRRERHPVRARHEPDPHRHDARVPPQRWLRHRPDRLRRGRPRGVPERHRDVRQLAKVPVRTAGSQPVTSAHLPNTGGVIEAADGVAWGNGPNSATAYAGPAVDVECVTCHNPHGNGAYRILNPIPDPAGDGRRRVRPGSRGGTGHRRGGPRRRRQPQLHHHPDERRHRDAHWRARWRPSACRQRRATTSGEGSRGTPRAARPTTRRTACPRPSPRRSPPGA